MKNLIIGLFLFLSVNLFSQVKHNFDKLSRMVFDEINLERVKSGLMSSIWNDTLLQISKTTNRILKNDNKLYHPDFIFERDTLDKYERLFVNQYRKLTNNKHFEYKSYLDWGLIRSYTQYGEVIGLYNVGVPDSVISKDVVKTWLKSERHNAWILIHNTLVYHDSYPLFCACDSDYKLHNNEQHIIVTCNLYVVNIKSGYQLK